MSTDQPGSDTAFKVVDAFNESGFPFQGAVLEETGRLFAARRSPWIFEVEEYPVSVGGRSARVDFVLTHPRRPWFLLAECKRVLPGGGWAFARSGYVRRDYDAEEVLVDRLRRLEHGPVVRSSVSLGLPARPVYHQGVVVKSTDLGGAKKFKVSRDAINSACDQLFLGVNGFLNRLAEADGLWERSAVVMPVLFTTATLLAVDRKLSEADLCSGALPLDSTATEVPWLWLRQHVSPQLQSSQPFQRSESQRTLGESLSRQLDNEFGRTVAVVNYSGIEDFLAFTGGE